MKCHEPPKVSKIMIMLERPLTTELRHGNDQERNAALHESTKRQRANILAWIEEQGLSGQLVRLDEPTKFYVLQAEGTPTLAASLQFAPGILCVALVGDFELKVLDEFEKSIVCQNDGPATMDELYDI